MKVSKIIPYSILATLTFSFYLGIRYGIEGSTSPNRAPANTLKNGATGCMDALKGFTYGASKAQRLKVLRKAKDANDFETFSKAVLDSHDNTHIQKGEIPNGFSEKKADFIEYLMRRTNNDYVTAYYQHYEPKDYDTWGIFDYVTKGEDLTTEEGELVYKRMMGWYDNYVSYRERLNDQVVKSFESKMRLEKTLEHFEANKKTIKKFNFRNGNRYYIELPVAVKDPATGQWTMQTERQGFSNMPNLKNFIKDLELEVDDNFSDGLLDETFYESRIFKVIIDQAFYRKRLEFIRDRLGDLPDSNLTDTQKELFEKFDAALHRGDLMPRSDSFRFEQNRELRSELKSFFKGQKSRRKVLENFKVRLVRKFGDEIKDKSQYFTTIKAVLWGQTIVAGFGVVIGTAMLPFTENDYLLYYTSSFQNWLNDTLLASPLETTLTMHECAKENRQWTVENLCLAQFLYSHLSSKLYKSRIDENYDYLEDEEYLKRREELTEIYLKKRDELNVSKFFSDNIDYVKEEGYQHYTAQTFLELADVSDLRLSKEGLSKEAKEDIYKYLTSDHRPEEESILINSIERRVGQQFTGLVKEVKADLPAYAKKVRARGSVKEDIEAFLESGLKD
jgi:hypothetical protein